MDCKRDIPKLEGRLVESLKVEEVGSLAKEYTELALDFVLEEGIAKDIPIVNTIVTFCKIGANVRERLYVRKLLSFLAEAGDTTWKDREALLNKHCRDSRRFEETVLLILEQADRIEKSTLIGKIFKACILGMITYIDALRLSEMVNRAFWQDLERMFQDTDRAEHWPRLFAAGLYQLKGEPLHFNGNASFTYERNDYASALVLIHQEKFDDLRSCAIGVIEERE